MINLIHSRRWKPHTCHQRKISFQSLIMNTSLTKTTNTLKRFGRNLDANDGTPLRSLPLFMFLPSQMFFKTSERFA